MTRRAVELDRARLLARRAAGQGLRGDQDLPRLGVLDFGVQDAPAGSAALAVSVRTGDPLAGHAPDLVRVLSVRGAPHLHRRHDLPLVRRELRPHEPADLRAWLGGQGPAFLASGLDPLAVLDQVVELLTERFPGDRATKGMLSAAISPHLPPPARPWCEGCRAHHVIENLFRLGTLLAGLELDRDDRALVFRSTRHPVERERSAADGSLVRAFARYAGPLRSGDLRSWLSAGGVDAPSVRRAWTDIATDLVPVRVGTETLYLCADQLETITNAPAAPRALLLPPRDPWLAGPRQLLVKDRALARQVWRPQTSPGVLLVDGEVRGTWRQRVSGRAIHIDVTAWDRQPREVRVAVADQAQLVAAVHGGRVVDSLVSWGD